MSRTNHHISYNRANRRALQVRISNGWNRVDRERIPRGQFYIDYFPYGNETWDLRYYAGCKRVPQAIRKTVDTYGFGYYCHKLWLKPGIGGQYADLWERQLRRQVRDYRNEARKVHRAGGDLDELAEPDRRARSISWDLW